MSLWTTDGSRWVHDPQGNPAIYVNGEDGHFAKILCMILNSTPSHVLSMTEEEMRMRGYRLEDR